MKGSLKFICLMLAVCLSSSGKIYSRTDSLALISRLEEKRIEQYNSLQKRASIRTAKKEAKLIHEYYGPYHDINIRILLTISETYGELKAQNHAIKYHNKAHKYYSRNIKDKFIIMSEAAREDYWKYVSPYFETTRNISAGTLIPNLSVSENSIQSIIYNTALLSKGILLNTTMEFNDFVRQSGDSLSIASLTELNAAISNGESRAKIDSLDSYIKERLKGLDREVSGYNRIITWKQVQEAMNEDDLAIEFYTSGGFINAVVLKKDWRTPKIINLNNTVQVGKKKFLNINKPDDYLSNIGNENALKAFSRAVWRKIMRYFPKTSEGRIFFSADGAFNQICIEYLPAYNSDEYIPLSDMFKMYRLSSTRQLVTEKEAYDSYAKNSASLYGGAHFAIGEGRLKHAVTSLDSGTDFIDDSKPRIMSIRLPYLQYSKEEVLDINRILKEENIDADAYVGMYATEEAVKRGSSDKEIIHLATHGFYESADDIRTNPNVFFRNLMAMNPESINDPLYRAGLFFTGSLPSWEDAASPRSGGLEDGILTAKEISLMDLSKANLVVLSACNSAQGDLGQDGVFGLQRAFKKAGVKSMIMTLWEVSDEATKIMMDSFYRHYAQEKMHIYDAFMAAQRDLRGNPEFSSPYFWSSFIILDAQTN